MGLPNISVKRPVTILMVFLAVVLIGYISLTKLPIELMPNISFGEITVWIDIRGGMPPVDVETLVTKPVEEAVGTVAALKSMTSISEEGRSMVVLSFEPGTDMDFASLEVREKFAKVKNKLPKEIEKPIIAKFNQSDVPVMVLAVTGLGYTPEMLRKVVDERIKERIERISGVANVEVVGGRERKILVEFDKARLAAYGLSMERIINVLGASNLDLLVGKVEKQRDEYIIRTLGQFREVKDIGEIGIFTTVQGSIVRLKDVATVKDSYLEPTGFARVNVNSAVSIYIQKESLANTISVVNKVEEEIKKIKPLIDKDIRIITTLNQAEAIIKEINRVMNSLRIGGLLAIAVLFLFLLNWRPTAIIAVAIPISVLITFGLMYFQKVTLNIMTLSGLALGIGMLVDNGIVVIENIYNKIEKGMDVISASISGSEEMLLAIVASTVTTIVVFLPIVFVSKEIKLLYSGLSLTVTFSLISSLVVAITLVPTMASRLIKPRAKEAQKPKFSFKGKSFFAKFKSGYKKSLVFSIRYRYILIMLAALVFALSILLLTRIPVELMEQTEPGTFTIFIELPTGARLEASDSAVSQVENFLKNIPEIMTVSSRIEPWESKIYVKLVPSNQRDKSTRDVIDSLRPQVAKIPNTFIYFEEAQQTLAREIILDLYGYNYDILKELAVSVASRLEAIKGLTDVKIRAREGRPEWRVTVDRKKAALYGFTIDDIASSIHGQMRGLRATVYHTEAKEVEVITRLSESDRKTLDNLHKLILTGPGGIQVNLDQVATFELDLGPSKIYRRNKSRMIQVSANIGRLSYGKAIELSGAGLKDLKFPKDYFWKFGGAYTQMVQNQKELTFALLITLVLIYLVLASLFESYAQPFIILVTVPLAVIGVVFSLKLTHTSISMGVFIGAIILGGIVVNSAIILIDHVNSLVKNGFSKARAVILAGQDRLRPILMTTLTTVFGMLPMVIDRSEEAGLWAPLAITVTGGLISSTILTLFFVPSVYSIFKDVKGILVRKTQENVVYEEKINGIKV